MQANKGVPISNISNLTNRQMKTRQQVGAHTYKKIFPSVSNTSSPPALFFKLRTLELFKLVPRLSLSINHLEIKGITIATSVVMVISFFTKFSTHIPDY